MEASDDGGGTILIVEDDEKTATLVAIYLERAGFKTLVAHDGAQALKMARRYEFIFAILDLMLPEIDGWEVCRELRRTSDIPILILTARKEEVDRISGLMLGADDYVVKPFSPGELVARVKAILRRARSNAPKAEVALAHGKLSLNPEKRRVMLDGQQISLTPSEFKLLKVLMSAPGRVFLRGELVHQLYPRGEAVVDRVVDVHIGNLRQKIEDEPSNPQYVLTVRGVGYQFADDGQ